ncbi:MAG: TIGR00295 family protein [Thermodesulfovibrionales bacterium]
MIKDTDLKYLKEAGCSDSVIRHCVVVTKKALEIADEVMISVDKELIKKGGINHDIGRSKTHGIGHAVVGAEIAEKYDFEEEVIRIIERHIGAGLTAEEAARLGLPPGDYIPHTPEEIIVAYADNLVLSDRIESFEKAIESFRINLGKDHPAIERFLKMHDLIQSWMK